MRLAARVVAIMLDAGGAINCGLCLEFLDAFSLQPFGALGNGKLHRFALVERPVSFGLDGRVMDEDIISGSALDESIALRVVEPLHDTLFSIHIVSVFL